MHLRNTWVSLGLGPMALVLGACAPSTKSISPDSPPPLEPSPVAIVVPSEPSQEEPALATVLMGDSVKTSLVGERDRSVFALSGEDPAMGRPDALVTLVVFGSIQCPFTQRHFRTLLELGSQYGERDLRIVWKHMPLAFHKESGPAAEASVAVHRLGGARAFYCFLTELFDDQRNLGSTLYQRAAQTCGVNPGAMEAEVRSGQPTRKVEMDQKIAEATGTRGTPQTFVNGKMISGAQPAETFRESIDAERKEARAALSSGISPIEVHAHRVEKNFVVPTPTPTPSQPVVAALPDTTVYYVPVGQSPVLGSPNALITIVMFQDFQCPFCKRSIAAIEALRTEFGNDLRVVFKHNPLPFHKEALRAARLAMEAKARKGNQGFWQAHDALFAEPRIDEAALDRVAQILGMDLATAHSVMAGTRHQSAIEADIQLAQQLGAKGIPTFFVNGRKLVGAQPIEKFRTLISEVLPAARALSRRGVPRSRIYAETIKNGAKGP